MALTKANQRLAQLAERIGAEKFPEGKRKGPHYVGVDIGTANVVTVVLDEAGAPLACQIDAGKVVREGMVVDYFRAVKLVEMQKQRIEEQLGTTLRRVASAVPPGTEEGNGKVTRNILEAAGYEVLGIIDEPTAASLVLDIEEGAVVDVGGGTTGISILKNGAVTFTADEATGGFHFDLVIAGALGISTEEAEAMKRDVAQQKRLYPVVEPVMEKVAAITRKYLQGRQVGAVYLVGGTCAFAGFSDLMQRQLGVPVFLPDMPLLVTPMGIAAACRNMAMEHDGKKV